MLRIGLERAARGRTPIVPARPTAVIGHQIEAIAPRATAAIPGVNVPWERLVELVGAPIAPSELSAAIDAFQNRERKFGSLPTAAITPEDGPA